ncbi:hypothetical protein BaRGS_00021374 [Batillaria attramentaria]|uniref:tetrahydrofolate synthase n=1 Tax=Batillaria attramentaria TaxID=370345 RepID=A0ABD0KK10_9CAEN
MQSGVPAITVPQSTNSAMDVILKRAEEKGCRLYVAQPLASTGLPGGLPLGIAGDRQRYNAALAVQLCQVWLQTRANSLSSCRWDGRYQTICRPGVTYYLDGAHTPDSIEACAQWFKEAAEREADQLGHKNSGGVCRSLVFNVTGGRDASTLLDKFKDCGFQRAAFCPNTWQDPTGRQDAELPKIDETVLRNRAAWENLQSVCTPDDVTARQHKGDAAPENPCVSQAFPCVMSALAWAAWDRDEKISAVMVGNGNTETGQHVQVLVTGSLYLVGAVLGGLAK